MCEAVIRALLQPINPAFNSILGFFSISWGVWVAAPWWDVFTTAEAFRRTLVPESFWGSLAIAVGILILWSSFEPKYRRLIVSLGLAAAFWGWASLTLLFGDWRNTAWITYGWVAVSSIAVYLNVRVNHANGHEWVAEVDDVE